MDKDWTLKVWTRVPVIRIRIDRMPAAYTKQRRPVAKIVKNRGLPSSPRYFDDVFLSRVRRAAMEQVLLPPPGLQASCRV